MFHYFENKNKNAEKLIYLYKSNFFKNNFSKKINKVVVFDIDETIGSFGELVTLWNCLDDIKRNFNIAFNMDQVFFNSLLDLYPEFLRPGIITIFEFINHKKKMQECKNVYLYTNNIYSPDWPIKISNYLDYRLNVSQFIDKTICAFKVNNVILEPMRTTNKKTYSDLIRCSMLPKTTEICFIDDTLYDKMKNDKVYYIRPKEYRHNLTCDKIVNRFIKSHLFDIFFKDILDKDIVSVKKNIQSYFDLHCLRYENFELTNNEINILVTQKLMFHIKEFFYSTIKKSKTKKIKFSIGRLTRKKVF
jgi:hypothetical protein